MSAPTTAEPSRYDPFTHNRDKRSSEESIAGSEREAPEPVAPVVFRAADQDEVPGGPSEPSWR